MGPPSQRISKCCAIFGGVPHHRRDEAMQITSGVHHTFMVNCSSSVSQSRSQRLHAICTGGGRHRRAGGTFLTNHVDGIAAVDLFVLPTISFRLLYCLVRHVFCSVSGRECGYFGRGVTPGVTRNRPRKSSSAFCGLTRFPAGERVQGLPCGSRDRRPGSALPTTTGTQTTTLCSRTGCR